MTARLRSLYGESPWHLIGHLLAFAAAGWAVYHLLDTSRWLRVLVWLVGAALVHDLVFGPGVALGDRLLRRGVPARRRAGPSPLNHVRFVLVVSGVLFLVFFPLILHRSEHNYVTRAGHPPGDYLGRWAAITAGLALASALVYLVRRRRSRQVDHLDGAVRPAADEDSAGARVDR